MHQAGHIPLSDSLLKERGHPRATFSERSSHWRGDIYLVSTRNLAALVLLAAIWGSSYLFIRVAVDPLGPLMVAFARVGTAGLGLAGYALLTGKRKDLAGLDRRFLMLGLGNAA